MAKAYIEPDDPKAVPILFGPRDRNLKRLREALGVEIVYRNEQLKLTGEEDLLPAALEVVEQLLQRAEQTGAVSDRDLSHALGEPENEFGEPSLDEEPEDEDLGDSEYGRAVDIFEKRRNIKPRSAGQNDYLQAMRRHDLVFCDGPAGSGKTYLAVAMALHALRSRRVRKIVLVRPAVEAGERLGFLPGDMLAKVNPFLRPLLDALSDLVGGEASRRYMEEDIVEVVPLAFMRGRTLNQTFMILDEAQNTTVTQMKMFLTRMGEKSKIVVTGDHTQVDLATDVPCGLTDAMGRLSNVSGVSVVKLSGQDIVRHRLVRDIVRAYDWEG